MEPIEPTTEGPLTTRFVCFVDNRCRYIISRSSRGKIRNEIDIGTRKLRSGGAETGQLFPRVAAVICIFGKCGEFILDGLEAGSGIGIGKFH